MWNKRYAEPGFAYGQQPNVFLAEVIKKLVIQRPSGRPHGRALCLAAGEGRNAVFLAELGFEVTAVDRSPVGLEKAAQTAKQRSVSIHTEVVDLADYMLPLNRFDLIVSIFAHVPPPVRHHIHAQIPAALVPGGTFILEAYTPEQVGRGTGGPPVSGPMMTKEALRQELDGLNFTKLHEIEREVVEGRYHTGNASVVQVIATRPVAVEEKAIA